MPIDSEVPKTRDSLCIRIQWDEMYKDCCVKELTTWSLCIESRSERQDIRSEVRCVRASGTTKELGVSGARRGESARAHKP